jgi:prevent-host-death family protein
MTIKRGKMEQVAVGIRELKARLSHYLAQVKASATIIVTERGRAIARIMPEGEPWAIRLRELMAKGILDWSGHRLRPMMPVARTKDQTMVSELLLENRE